ncbi:MAG: protease inhibitor I42 family protein [Bacteroidales bacterium]|nr:protease inhibitor I42 family protein [Bacteroidales bacterium]
MKKIIFLLLTVISLLIVSCGMPKEAAKTPDGGNPMSFTCKDNKVIVKLIGNATTGYTWSYKIRKPDLVKYVSDEYKPNESNGKVGVGGVHTFTFEALKTGTCPIVFEYSQQRKNGNTAGGRILLIMVDPNNQVSAAEYTIK